MSTPSPLYRPAKTAAHLGISKPTLYRYEKAGRLPPRVVLGPGVSGWRLSDLERFLDSCQRGGDARRGSRELPPATEAA